MQRISKIQLLSAVGGHWQFKHDLQVLQFDFRVPVMMSFVSKRALSLVQEYGFDCGKEVL